MAAPDFSSFVPAFATRHSVMTARKLRESPAPGGNQQWEHPAARRREVDGIRLAGTTRCDCALAWAGSPRGRGPDQTAAWSRRDAPGCSAVRAVPAPTVAPPRRVPLACYATRQPHDLPPTPFSSRHMSRENDKQRTPTCGRTRGGGCYMMPGFPAVLLLEILVYNRRCGRIRQQHDAQDDEQQRRTPHRPRVA
jgi:hypothetical protein